MEGHTVREWKEDMQVLATALLQQGERCALAGLQQQAEGILVQVWSIAGVAAPDLANVAAWELAWLLVRRAAYAEAMDWFRRVEAPLARASPLWPAAQETIVQICEGLANQRSELAAASPRTPRMQPVSARDALAAKLPKLTVANLGHFQIIRAGALLSTCPAHKAIAVFRYLLSRHDRAAHKEELIDLFWPAAQAREGANSLYVAMSTLRRHLDPRPGSYLLFEDSRYAINPHAPVEDDSSAFQQLSDAGEQYWRADDIVRAEQAYIHALAYYRGDYYVDARDLTWAITVQAQLLSRYLTVLDHLGQIFIKQRRFEQAVECYQRLLERDSYREDAYCQLMRCYWQLDRRGDALRQYDRCATLLANDLGLTPLPELQELYHAIHTAVLADSMG